MKIVVINDDDGHTNVFSFTLGVLKACLAHLIDIGHLDDEAKGQELIDSYTTTPEEIEAFLRYEHQIQRGGRIAIEEIKDNWDFRYGPWG